MREIIIVISSDPEIIDAAEGVYDPGARNPVLVFGYRIQANTQGWSKYDGTNWTAIGDYPAVKEEYHLIFSGHGNSDEIGREDGHDVGPDLDAKATAQLIHTMQFTGNRIVLSVCGTHGIYNTFANKLAAVLVGVAKGSRIFYPLKSLDADRNPTSIVDMDSIEVD